MPSIGFSLFLIAAGAILRYAVTASVEGVSLTTVGLILMIIGIVGLVISLLFVFAWGPWQSRNARGRVDGQHPYDRPPGSF
jgi:heme/copper-type cytochrome/quinol oxidase subunit 2